MTEILQWPADSLTGKTLLELTGLVRTIQISVQWIPAHCSIWGNEQKTPWSSLHNGNCQLPMTESLQSPADSLTRETMQKSTELGSIWQVTVQWMHAHCGIWWNEQTYSLARQEADYNIPSRGRNHHQTNTPSKKAGRTQSTALSDSNRPPSSVLGLDTAACSNTSQCRLGLAHTEDCPCQAGPRSPEYVLQFCPSSEKQDHGSGPMEQRYRNSCGATWRTIVFIQIT